MNGRDMNGQDMNGRDMNERDTNGWDTNEQFDDDKLFKDLYDQYVNSIREETNKENLLRELKDLRREQHQNFLITKNNCQGISTNTPLDDISITKHKVCEKHDDHQLTQLNKKPWPKGTYLIIGDSLLSGVEESRLGKKIKIRCHPGACINDIYSYAVPLLGKKPDGIILMVGTNDSVNKCSQKILNELLELKKWIIGKLPGADVVFSCPTLRHDNQKARLTIIQLRNKLSQLKVNTISNDNLFDDHLGYKGLHLNRRGSSRLAWNYLTYIRKQ